MSVQHQVGEQAHQRAVALHGEIGGSGPGRWRWARCLEQNRQPPQHAVEMNYRQSFGPSLTFEDGGPQRLVVRHRCFWQPVGGQFFYGFFLRAIARSMLRG